MIFDCSLFGLMVCFLITDNAPRPFLGLRCGVPPRQAQINNDASGKPSARSGPPAVVIRPGKYSVPMGQEGFGTAPTDVVFRRDRLKLTTTLRETLSA